MGKLSIEASMQLHVDFYFSSETQARNLFYIQTENRCMEKLSILSSVQLSSNFYIFGETKVLN